MDALAEGWCWTAGLTRLHLTRALRAWAVHPDFKVVICKSEA